MQRHVLIDFQMLPKGEGRLGRCSPSIAGILMN